MLMILPEELKTYSTPMGPHRTIFAVGHGNLDFNLGIYLLIHPNICQEDKAPWSELLLDALRLSAKSDPTTSDEFGKITNYAPPFGRNVDFVTAVRSKSPTDDNIVLLFQRYEDYTPITIFFVTIPEKVKPPKKSDPESGTIIKVVVGGKEYDTVIDEHGRQRFIENPDHPLMKKLKSRGRDDDIINPDGEVEDLNEMNALYRAGEISKRDYAEFNMALGYSIGGFRELSCFYDWDIENPLWNPSLSTGITE